MTNANIYEVVIVSLKNRHVIDTSIPSIEHRRSTSHNLYLTADYKCIALDFEVKPTK